ncbi:hypothetical protein LJC33_02385 [Eubacteriales bacterium OttesenSCG-928-N13]|nr:hypothetical protein [Eubacteriales bacterium OttesenSCG-928-N13]
MKKMMRMLSLVLMAVMLMSVVAFAEIDLPIGNAPQQEASTPDAPKTEEPTPDAPKTEEPTPNADASATEESVVSDDVVVFEEEEVPLADGKLEFTVAIKCNKKNPKFGDTLKLKAKIDANQDLKGKKIKYQWQVDTNDGEGWKDIKKNAKKATYKVKYTKKKADYQWRVLVTIEE